MKRREGGSREKLTPLGVANGPSTVVEMEKLGPPGIPGVIVYAANFPDDTRQESERLFDYAVRPIKVYATLSKVPPLNERIAADTGPSDGASYLAVRWKNARLDLTTSDGAKFRITPNPDGELSFVEFECAANSIASARVAFQRTVLPILDYLSYSANCPLFIGSIRFHDAKNDCDSVDYVSPYRQAIVNDVPAKILERMQPIYSMYREAKNASSNFYRFLCYYKILEGLLNKMRAAVYNDAKARGLNIKTSKLLVPADPNLPDHIVGQPMKDFFDNVLGLQFRNAVAHFVTDDGSTLDMSEPGHLDRYAGVILVSELCVRAAIADHEALLEQIR